MKIWKKDHYEQLFRKRAKTVDDYQLIISHAQEQIHKLQSVCPHAHTKPGFFSWRPGAMSPTLLCQQCRASVPGITDEQIKELWNSFNQGFDQGQDSGDSISFNVVKFDK